MASVTGPFVFIKEIKGPPNEYGYKPTWKWLRREWSRQKRPYLRPLPYRFTSQEVKWSLNSTQHTVEYYGIEGNPFLSINSYEDRVYRSAYAKFLDQSRSSSAELLTLFCERREAANMITDRVTRFAAGLIAVKQRNKRALKQAWGKGAGWREHARQKGSHILEYSFGWAPLMSDIASAVETLDQGTFDSGRVSMKSTFHDSLSADYGAQRARRVWRTQIGIRMGWKIVVRHPSLALLNQLGLINLASTAWERTPWSFVVDYFVNLNDVIASMTALAGCELLDEWKTTFILDNYSHLARWAVSNPPSYPPKTFGGESVSVIRVLDIPRPSLGVRAPWNLSWGRASTSVALLLQQLK